MYAKTHRKHAWKLKGEFEQYNTVNNKCSVNVSELISLVGMKKKLKLKLRTKWEGNFLGLMCLVLNAV